MRQRKSKYQSSIAHILKPLAAILILFVLYQAWIKPTYLASPPPFPQSASAPVPSPPMDLTVPMEELRGPMFVPRIRTMDPGEAPSPALGLIRDELEKGNVREVEAALKKRSKTAPAKLREREYVAALWNNMGIQQERYGGVVLSVHAFKEAVKLAPRNPTAHLNLTQAYWELRHPAMTMQFLETVIRLAPEEPFPHLALADLLLDKGQATVATTHLDQARKGAELDPSITPYLQKLTARAETFPTQERSTVTVASFPKSTAVQPSQPAAAPRETVQVPSITLTKQTPTAPINPPEEPQRTRPSSSSAHFAVQYDGKPDDAAWARMRAILEYAFDEITPKFGHVPVKPFTVVLHLNQKFVGTASTPSWADTLFDQASGAIHVPVQEALEDLALFSRVVRHEFVHALLLDYLKGKSTAVPTWLIEGLAIQLADDPWPNMEEVKVGTTAVIPLSSLQGPWKQLSPESIPIAYLEACSAVQHLMDQYSMYNLRHLITLVRTGQSLDTAMLQKLSVSYEQFQRQWEQGFRASLNSRSS
jgi:tetratricopeptide (TPR) repeat protein